MGIYSSIKKAVRLALPYKFLEFYSYRKSAKMRKAAKYSYGTSFQSYCPICNKEAYFLCFSPRQKTLCPYCCSMERHRLLWFFFKSKTNLFKRYDQKILHVAPERCFEGRLKKIFGENYTTADLCSPYVMVKMDICDIPYPNESFDIIICNHVLEHVMSDIKAMAEFHRILKKNGWAILLVPIADIEKTFEDFSLDTDAERLKAFGQTDHVRKYGRDYIDRLKSAGFDVTTYKPDEIATTDEIEKMRLKEDPELWGFACSEIFYCVKT